MFVIREENSLDFEKLFEIPAELIGKGVVTIFINVNACVCNILEVDHLEDVGGKVILSEKLDDANVFFFGSVSVLFVFDNKAVTSKVDSDSFVADVEDVIDLNGLVVIKNVSDAVAIVGFLAEWVADKIVAVVVV